MGNGSVLVVIVNFRVPELLVDCLASIKHELPPDGRVVVVENGSGDNSADILAQAIRANGWGAWCDLLISEQNLGFTGGNNLPIGKALEQSSAPRYFWLLNPDTVARPGALRALLEFMEQNPAVGIAGSRLEHPDGTPQRSAFRFKTIRGEFEANARTGPVTRLLRRFVVAPPVVRSPDPDRLGVRRQHDRAASGV
jgi:GT2 family glycosyltransferase